MDLDYEKRRDYYRAYFKKRAAADKKNGICVNCRKTGPVPGRTCCQMCLDDKKLTLKFGSAGPYRQLYADLFERQNGKCSICKKSMKRPVLDHCHKTMEVRGLLCSRCNIGLGQFQDDLDLLESASAYIRNNAGIGIKILNEKGKHRKRAKLDFNT